MRAGTWWLWGGALVAFFAVGVPFWRIPYEEVAFPNSLAGAGLLVVTIVSLLSTRLGWARVRRTILFVGGAVPAAVLVRIALELGEDPSIGQLWPFQLVIAAFAGAVASAPGAVLGSVPDLVKLLRRD